MFLNSLTECIIKKIKGIS